MEKQSKKRVELMTPEEIEARARRAKRRFRAAIRSVIENRYWLVDDVPDQGLGDNIDRNITLVTRKKIKKSLLSIADKILFYKLPEYRTHKEIARLTHVIGGLRCFRSYSANIKMQLAQALVFVYYGPGRLILRQNHPSHNAYVVISGTASAWHEEFNASTKENVKEEIAVLNAGQLFGDHSVLYDNPRVVSVTSTKPLELLYLHKSDFNIILKETVMKHWANLRSAMDSFSYFEDWVEKEMHEFYMLAKIETFVANQTILGDGVGLKDTVYFIVKGRCRVIEHLLVKTEIVHGYKCHKLYVPPSLQQSQSLILLNSQKKDEAEAKRLVRVSNINVDNEVAKAATKSELSIKNVNDVCSSKNITKENIKSNNAFVRSMHSLSSNKQRMISKSKEVMQDKRTLGALSGLGSLTISGKSEEKVSTIATTAASVNLSTRRSTRMSAINLPQDVEIHFMQVCFLNSGGCFGIGENTEHRRIVAVNDTDCLIIPRYLLMKKNEGNIWNRIKQFMDTHIPTTKQVFQEFVNYRKWLVYRKKIAESVYPQRKITNNSFLNVPYFIRINEEIDY